MELLGALLLPQYLTPLFCAELVFYASLSLWLYSKPSKVAAGVATGYQIFGIASNVISLFSSDYVPNVTSALVIHLILRTAAVIAMWSELGTKNKDPEVAKPPSFPARHTL